MTYDILLKLQARLNKLFADQVYEKPVGGKSKANLEVAPLVELYDLPKKKPGSSEESEFPFIILRPNKGGYKGEEQHVSINILCGVYSSEGFQVGGRDINQMVHRICDMLMAEREVGNKYGLVEDEVDWTFGEDKMGNQPDPYYLGIVPTTWQGPGVTYVADLQEG